MHLETIISAPCLFNIGRFRDSGKMRPLRGDSQGILMLLRTEIIYLYSCIFTHNIYTKNIHRINNVILEKIYKNIYIHNEFYKSRACAPYWGS